jgi:hypothetical protein
MARMFALDVSGSGNGGVAVIAGSGLAIALCERRSARSATALAVD